MGKALTVQIVGDASSLKRAFNDSGSAASKFGSLMKKAGLAVAGAAIAGTVASIKAFADFDAAMTQSTAIMGDLSDAMRKDMSDAAREVGRTTKFSAKEAAESYFFLASAGLDAQQSIKAMPVVARFAQAGMFDMARATDLATDAQSALGLSSDNANKHLKNLTRVTDVFVKANILANTSVEQISEAMTNKAGAAMRALGMDVEEGAAVLAAFADQGVKGAEAGTQFSIVLRDLQTKALKNKEEFKEAGIAVFDASGEFRNMGDVIGDLEGHLDGMSDAQKKAALATLGFSDKSMASLITLLGTSEAIREYEGELRNAAGLTQEVADKQMQTFWAQLGLLKDQFVDIGISIGETLMPGLMRFVAWVQEQMPAIEAIFSGAFGVIKALFGETTGVVTGELDGWARRLTTSKGEIDGWARAAISSHTDTRGALEKVADFITDDLIPAFTAIRAWWDRNWPQVKQTLEEFKSVAGEVFGSVKDFIDEKLIPAFQDLRNEWEDDSSALNADLREMSRAWREAWTAIGNLINSVKETFGIATSAMGDDASLLSRAVGLAVRLITDKLEIAATAAKFLQFAWEHTIGRLIAKMSGFATAVRERLRQVGEAFDRIRAWIRDALAGIPDWLEQVGRDMIAGLVRGIVGGAGSVAGAIGGVVSGAISAAKSRLGISSPSKVFAKIGDQITEGLSKGIDGGTSAVVRSLDKMTKKMRERVTGEVSRILSAINAATGAVSAAGSLVDARGNLRSLTREGNRLPGNIADAEKAVAEARKRAKEVTVEEELAILQARQAAADKLRELKEVEADATSTAEARRIAEIEYQLAAQRNNELLAAATAKTDEVRQAEEHLAELRKRSKTITGEQTAAQLALISAQASAIGSQLQLASALDELGKVSRPVKVLLGQLAAAADITGPSLRRLLASLQTPVPEPRKKTGKRRRPRNVKIIVNDRSGDPVETARRTALALRVS